MAANTNIRNIRPEEPDGFEWDGADPAKSLQKIRNAVEVEGQKAIDWYWKAKRWKRIPSQSIQFCALLLTAAAGLVPIILQLVKNAGAVTKGFDSGPLASLFVGIAAALLGLDKAFGYSSGWTRYVLTATSMTKLLHEFRMDWIALSAAAAAPPTTEQRTAMIQRAKDFVSTIQGMVAQETKDWAAEFQSNMAQMEKDLKTQLDTLKVQVPTALGYVMGVADLIAELRPSSTNFTNSCHFNRLLGANPQDSTGTSLFVRVLQVAEGNFCHNSSLSA